jgi:hypothetical protein
MPAPLSVISDCCLPDQEILLFKQSHIRHLGRSDFYSVILQHIWGAYGVIVQDRCLRYASLAYSLARSQLPLPGYGLSWEQRVSLMQFISEVHHGLSLAITEGTVSESHLFALLLIKLAACGAYPQRAWEFQDFISEQMIYEGIFLEVLNHLSCQQSDKQFRAKSPLGYLWSYALSYICRTTRTTEKRPRSRYVLEARDANENNELPWSFRAYLVRREIPDWSLSFDPRVSAGMFAFDGKGTVSPWMHLIWNVRDNTSALAGCIETVFISRHGSPSTRTTMAQLAVQEIRGQLAELQNLPCISNLFKMVRHLADYF